MLGLGNLHNRFSYNSSFMCLQALFSFSWFLKQSLHTLNGFLWVFMMIYAIGDLKIYCKNKVYLSDIFKLLILQYLCGNIKELSSPHTDMMVMLLVIYIITRWVEFLEKEEKNYIPYGLLCLLGVFAVSVKLSAGLILILTLKPAIELVVKKKWKTIIVFIVSGIIIIFPFLVRNVMLSGYLIYPYANIDLFNVDWKMPASQVIFDNHEIMAWGRLLNDVKRYFEPITVWLPIWLEKCGAVNRRLMLLNLCLLPVMIGMLLYSFYKKKYDQSLIIMCCIALFGAWFFTAPLPRYGAIYMYLLPSVLLFEVVRIMPYSISRAWKNIVCIMLVSIGMNLVQTMLDDADILKYGNRLVPKDYKEYSVEEILWNDMVIYLPEDTDQVSYHNFPSTPYRARLELIELRGEGIEDGFRIKEEYKGRKVDTHGRFLE